MKRDPGIYVSIQKIRNAVAMSPEPERPNYCAKWVSGRRQNELISYSDSFIPEIQQLQKGGEEYDLQEDWFNE